MRHQNLWAPWRISYLQGLNQDRSKPSESDPGAGGCFLCDAVRPDLSQAETLQRLIVLCDERGVLMMNRYPYANGHLLVAPRAHVANISDLTPGSRAGLMELADLGCRLLRRAMHCQGVNLGMNLGRCAGAGVPGHCHMHLVPRWNGDSNFMQVVAGARVIPQALEESYQAILAALHNV
ncbi:MAG: HIT domain-containing protein [Planctomycetota bacterium]